MHYAPISYKGYNELICNLVRSINTMEVRRNQAKKIKTFILIRTKNS